MNHLTMRILLITGSFPPMRCGVGDYTACLAKALGKRKDTRVGVLSDEAAGLAHPEDNIEIFPIIRGWTILDAVRIFQKLRDWRPDVVHIQFHTQGYGRHILPRLLPSMLWLLKVPVIQTWHECFYRQLGRGLPALPNLMIPGSVIVVMPNYRDMMHPWYRWIARRKQLSFIPNVSSIPKVQLTERERAVIRAKYAPGTDHLIAFFGFASPGKGIEAICDIADPKVSSLVLICDLTSADPTHKTFHMYHKQLLDRVNAKPWIGRATVTGFLPPDEVGRILAASDAAVFPFRDGGGIWNTSTKAATLQGTFVLVTGLEQHGYDPEENIYCALPGDLADMRRALSLYMGRRNDAGLGNTDWGSVAEAHFRHYSGVLNQGTTSNVGN